MKYEIEGNSYIFFDGELRIHASVVDDAKDIGEDCIPTQMEMVVDASGKECDYSCITQIER